MTSPATAAPLDLAPDVPHATSFPAASRLPVRSTDPPRPASLRPLGALALANALSLIGNVIATVAIPWLVLEATGSAALAALSIVSGAVAAAIGALVSGRAVDVLGAARASWVADVLSALALVPIPLLAAGGRLELWHLVVLVFAGTLADATGSTARQSLVPSVAEMGRVRRERANSLFTGTEHAGYLVGAPIAGLLVAVVGTAGAMWVDIATFAVSAAIVAALVPRVPGLPAGARSAGTAGVTDRARDDAPPPAAPAPDLRTAAGFIRSDPALRALVVIPTLATMLIGPLVPIILPVVARETYGDPVVLGVLIGAFGAGGLLGATAFGALSGRLPRRRLYVGVFLAWPFVYATLVVGAPIAVTAPAIALLGAAAGSLVALQATIRQERSPAHLLPRVVGLSTGPVPVVGPVAVLAVGVAIDAIGVGATLALMTAAIALLAVAVVRSDGVRRFDAAPATGTDAVVAEAASAPA